MPEAASVPDWSRLNSEFYSGDPAGYFSIRLNVLLLAAGAPYELSDLLVAGVRDHRPYGRYLASVGASPTSARLVGLRVDRMILSSFVVSGALSGVAGVLLLARAGTANPQVGPGFTLAALSAAFLGATAIRPGSFNVLGTLLGVLFVAVSVNGLVLAGAADWVEPTFNGTALLVAVSLSTAIARRRAGRT